MALAIDITDGRGLGNESTINTPYTKYTSTPSILLVGKGKGWEEKAFGGDGVEQCPRSGMVG